MSDSLNNQNEGQDYNEEEVDNGFLRWMSAIVVLVAIAGFFALAWYAYRSGNESVNEEDVAMVEADEGPIKEAPADPGGMQFPHQDKTVYDAIANTPQQHAAERVLPAPEEPVQMEKGAAGGTETFVSKRDAGSTADADMLKIYESEDGAAKPTTNAQSTGVQPKVITINPADYADASTDAPSEAEAAAPAIPTPAPVVAQAPVPVKEKPAVKTEVAQAKTVKTETKVAAKSEKAPVKSGAFALQLSAFKTEAEAEASWKKIASKHASLVSGYPHRIMKVDLGEKGIFYRVQLTGFGFDKEASSLCGRFKDAGQSCFVTK